MLPTNDMTSILIAVTLLVVGGVVSIVVKIIWDWLNRRNSPEVTSSPQDIASLTRAVSDLKKEVDQKIEALSGKVDKWAEKLLEHYATKRELDGTKNDQTELTIKVTENKTNIKLIMAQVVELFEKVDKVTEKSQELSGYIKQHSGDGQ